MKDKLLDVLVSYFTEDLFSERFEIEDLLILVVKREPFGLATSFSPEKDLQQYILGPAETNSV